MPRKPSKKRGDKGGVHIRKIRGKYIQLHWRQGGERKFLSLGSRLVLTGKKVIDDEVMLKAKQRAAEIEADLLAGALHELNPSIGGNVSLVDFMRSEIAKANTDKNTEHRTKPRKSEPLRHWTLVLPHVERFDKGKSTALKDVDDKFLAGFKRYLQTAKSRLGGHLKPTTARQYFDTVLAVLSRAVEDKRINRKPQAKRMKAVDVERKPALTSDDLLRLYQTPCDSDTVKRAFLFACQTSQRWGDIELLTWKEIKTTTRGVLIWECTQQKTGTTARIPLNEFAVQMIGERASAKDKVFPDLPPYHNTRRILQRWALSAGLEINLTFHVARHTAITQMMEHGIDYHTIQKISGHKDVRILFGYDKVTEQRKQRAVDSISLAIAKGTSDE